MRRLEAALGGTVVGRAGLVTVAGRSGHSRLQLSGSGSVLAAAAGSPSLESGQGGPGLHQHHQDLGVQPQPPQVTAPRPAAAASSQVPGQCDNNLSSMHSPVSGA